MQKWPDVGPRPERQPHLAAHAQHAVNAGRHPLLQRQHPIGRQGVLDLGGVGVAAAVLVDVERQRLVGRQQVARRPQQFAEAVRQHRPLAAGRVEQGVEPRRTHHHRRRLPAVDARRRTRGVEPRRRRRHLLRRRVTGQAPVPVYHASPRSSASIVSAQKPERNVPKGGGSAASQRRQDAVFQRGQAARRAVDELGVVHGEPAVVGVVGATDGGAQRRPQAGVGPAVLDAAGHGTHDERAEVRPIARLIDADDPDHETRSVGVVVPSIVSGYCTARAKRGAGFQTCLFIAAGCKPAPRPGGPSCSRTTSS